MAVAVSGGADSFALLHALHEKKAPIVALTVNHGLRPEAVDEAAKVAEWCAVRGIPHEILRWSEAPKGNLQAEARTARYRLLCEACNRLGIETLVTAHTADDQAETVFMRLRRGSGRGLAGMPETRLIAGGAGEPVTLYRPLLGVRRAETLAYAEAYDLPVSHDPSNEDERFERVRVRALLAALEQQDLLTVEALCRTARENAKRFAAFRRQLQRTMYAYEITFEVDGAIIFYGYEIDEADLGNEGLDEAPVFAFAPNKVFGHQSRFAKLCRRALINQPEEWGDLCGMFEEEGFGRSVRYPGGIREADRDTLAEANLMLARLAECLAPNFYASSDTRLHSAHDERIVASGVMFSMYADVYHILREPAALLGRADGAGGFDPIQVNPGEEHLYDRRFIVHVPETIQKDTILRPLGALMPREIATSTLDRQRISTLPCLSHRDRLTHVPAAAKDFICKSLAGWKGAADFLDGVGTFTADSLLEERFTGRVIRF